MSTTTPSAPPTDGRSNRLLAALPPDAYDRLRAELKPVTLPARQLLYEADAPIESVYFPTTAVASVLTLLADGSAVEAATIGKDGMVGLPLFLSLERDMMRVVNQVPGEALTMCAGAFRAALARVDGLVPVLQRHTQVVLTQMAQTAACNRMHPIDERCARWLLMTHDRVGADQFALTQEFLASMLGVRRPSVTLAAGMLQQAGFIRYQRGQITILDRVGLENCACECYARIAATSAQLLGGGDSSQC